MARQRIVEEESGTSTRSHHQHTHNGYYAGDFTDVPFLDPRHPAHTLVVTGTRRP